MNYEKAYKEALEKIREGLHPLPDGTKISGVTRAFLEEVFPELKESEDEKIRKMIINHLTQERGSLSNDEAAEAIAWLEKQGEMSKLLEDKDKLIKELGKYKVKYTQETLEKALTTNNKDDERLRKNTIAFLKDFADKGYENAVECIDWLEKQDEKKATEMKSPEESLGVSSKEYNEIVNECLYGESKPTDKVEPKFHEGDFVVSKITNTTYQIESVVLNVTNNKYGYDLTNGGYIASIEAYKYHLWTIQDAKDGDVLVYGDNPNDHHVKVIMIFKSWRNGESAFTYFHTYDNEVRVNDWCDCGKNAHPATKEQRDILFTKMKKAGYEFDVEKKELKLLISNGGDFESNNSKQKPTWSDEDDKTYYSLLADIRARQDSSTSTLEAYYNEQINWLKSLKERLS